MLKMDIEWWEFDSTEGFLSDFPSSRSDLPVGQFMVEVHLYNGMTAEGYLKWWEKLEDRGLRPTWTEPNLLAVTMGASPSLAEYTFINVKDKRSIIFGDAV